MGSGEEGGLTIIGCAEARVVGLKRYFTGRPCRSGHIAERLVSNGTCLRCQNASYAKAKEADPERFARYSRENGRRFHERHPERSRAYYDANTQAARERSQKWADENRERVRASKLAHKKRNPHLGTAYSTKRQAMKLKATPSWMTAEHWAQIEAIYKDAASHPGGPWHVDHIVPLIHPDICGLHVPWNLRIVHAGENWSKGNKLIEELAVAA